MSFSYDVKTELSKVNNLKNKEEVFYEFYGYLSTINTINDNKYIKFSTENEYNINRFSKLLNNININDYSIDIHNKIFSIKFKNNNTIEKLDLLKIPSDDNLKKAYIRGAFLSGGSITNPNNKYHLEINFNNIVYANITLKTLQSFDIKSKILDDKFILYIKDGEEISKFLALVGANLSVLKFEEIRVIRDMKNNINRIVNCETANINKTINASVEQISDIKKLKKSGKFNSLSEELKELANLREKNPDATYEQLGKMLNKPIGKSGVSNRFKKIKSEIDKKL